MLFGLFKKKENTVELWATAQGEEDSRPMVYRFRMNQPVGVAISNFPTLVNIYWKFDNSSHNGMPPQQDNDNQITFENAIDPLNTPQFGFLMLVVTGNGRKEWIWYVKDEGAWLEALNQKLSKHPCYPIQIQTNHDPEWSTYFRFQAGVQGA